MEERFRVCAESGFSAKTMFIYMLLANENTGVNFLL